LPALTYRSVREAQFVSRSKFRKSVLKAKTAEESDLNYLDNNGRYSSDSFDQCSPCGRRPGKVRRKTPGRSLGGDVAARTHATPTGISKGDADAGIWRRIQSRSGRLLPVC